MGIIDNILRLVGWSDSASSQPEEPCGQPYITVLPAVPGDLSQPVTVLRRTYERKKRSMINSC